MPYRNPKARQTYQREWARARRRENKILAVARLGGCCVRCGYKENLAALEIDHLVLRRRRLPDMGASQATQLRRGSLRVEEVQLLCANCHAIKTYEEDRLKFRNYI